MINFIYRRPGRAFSIENVFDVIYQEVYPLIPAKKTFMRHHRANLKSIFFNTQIARASQTEVNHITGDVHYVMLGLDDKNNNIITIHDLVYPEHLSDWKRAILKQLWYKIPLRKANYVTAISQKTATELIELIPEVESKLHIIHDPVSPIFEYRPKQALEPKPRVLHLGTKKNKNLARVILAMEKLNAELVIVGKLDEKSKALLAEKRIDNRNLSRLDWFIQLTKLD